MVYHTLLLASSLTVILVSAQRYPKSIQTQPRIGYSTNIVHPYSGMNDLQADSSISVNFQPQQTLNSRGAPKYTQTNGNTPNSNIFTRTPFASAPKSSNLFNVGYNLSFNDNSFGTKKKDYKYSPVHSKKFENAEVITGKIKKNEKVRAPINTDLSPQDFVSSAFLKNKQLTSGSIRHTSSPINTKLTSTRHSDPIREEISKYPSQSSTFTYNTQQNIFRDVIKATRPEPIQLNPDFKTSYETSGRWKNISPGAEKVEPIEPQEYDDFFGKSRGTKNINVAASNFNHAVALKNSETFDFSNAHGEISFGENEGAKDNSPASSEQYGQITSINNNAGNPLNLMQASDLKNLNIEAHLPKNLRGVKPLPLDTSLLKDPVLTTTFKEPSKYGRVIPIHFDIRPIQTVMQKELSKLQNNANPQNVYPNLQGQNYGYPTQQNYEQSLSPTSREALTYEKQEASPSQSSFRVYGKPEPINEDQYKVGLNYGKEHANYEEDIYKIVSMRPPPISQNSRY